MLWLPMITHLDNVGKAFFLSPVMFALFSVGINPDPEVCFGILAAYFVLLTILAWCFNGARPAFWMVPGVLFGISLVQGRFVAALVNGIDAIGHS
jgi:hypothetical protein